MNSILVVVVDGLANRPDQFPKVHKSIWVPEINLEFVIERFLVSIFPRTSFAAHGRSYTKLGDERDVIPRGIFAAVVRMKNGGKRMFVDCGEQGVHYELDGVSGEHREAHDLSREQVYDCREIYPSAAERNMCEVGYPDVVRIPRGLREEQIREGS